MKHKNIILEFIIKVVLSFFIIELLFKILTFFLFLFIENIYFPYDIQSTIKDTIMIYIIMKALLVLVRKL